jgi:hypothetical protein
MARVQPLLYWVIYLIIGILLCVLVMWIIKQLEKLWFKNNNTSGTSVMDSPVICALVDIIIYLISGLVLSQKKYPVWAVWIYIIVFEVVTQCFLCYWLPDYFNATWTKSVIDVILSGLAYWLSSSLKHKTVKAEKHRILKHFSCKTKKKKC